MSMTDITQLEKNVPILREIRAGNEVFWMNPEKTGCDEAMRHIELTMEDVEDAERRLQRFAPFIRACFPETEETGGLIESALTPVPGMKALLNERYGSRLQGALLLKQDSHLAIAGSVKARGGIYEVLKHTEELALEHGLLTPEDSYERLSSEECRQFFRQYTIQVGSTGNLGLSIGIMSAAIGYQVIVHMSADAKQWKKELLRSHGVTVREYAADYSEAVKTAGRCLTGTRGAILWTTRTPRRCFSAMQWQPSACKSSWRRKASPWMPRIRSLSTFRAVWAARRAA